MTQKSSLPDSVPSFPDLHPIVLCTASRRVQGAEASENGYIQGAADDHEAWSHGLTPPVFWKNKKLLMATNEEDAPGLVAKLLEQEDNSSTGSKTTLIQPTSSIFISSSQAPDLNDFDAIISCTPEPIPEIDLKSAGIKNYIHLKCQTGKLGSRDLRNELPRIPPSLESSPSISTPRLLVCCPTEKDLSVGTALAILCLYVNDAGALNLRNRRPASEIDKTFIKQRLSWITTSNPTLNPSRATLQSVNAFLLTSQDPKTLRQQAQHTLPIHSIPSSRAYSASISTPSPSNSSIQRTIFTNLYTTWSFHRTLTSVLPTHPSGTVTGTATFTPCTLPDSFPNTLLYAEEGDFVTTMGYRMSAKRKYVYQLADGDRDNDKTILVRFFDDENLPRGTEISGVGLRGEYIGGLFVEMGRLTPTLEYGTESQMFGDTTDGKAQYVAGNRESHLCGEDIYAAKWRFGRGVVQDGDGEQGDSSADMWWEVTYDVKGPKKDYKSVTRYEKVRT